MAGSPKAGLHPEIRAGECVCTHVLQTKLCLGSVVAVDDVVRIEHKVQILFRVVLIQFRESGTLGWYKRNSSRGREVTGEEPQGPCERMHQG
jgi:hypothetical protein